MEEIDKCSDTIFSALSKLLIILINNNNKTISKVNTFDHNFLLSQLSFQQIIWLQVSLLLFLLTCSRFLKCFTVITTNCKNPVFASIKNCVYRVYLNINRKTHTYPYTHLNINFVTETCIMDISF